MLEKVQVMNQKKRDFNMQSNLQKSSLSITKIKNMIENERLIDLDPEELVKELLSIQASIDEAVRMYEEEN